LDIFYALQKTVRERRGFLRTKKGTHTMSQQAEHEQQPLTPQEMRQHLTELGADQQAITELSDEQLEEIAGGGKWGTFFKVAKYGFEGVTGAATIGSLFGGW
jgi:hypothetical protein